MFLCGHRALFLFLNFEAGSQYVAQAGLLLKVLLKLPSSFISLGLMPKGTIVEPHSTHMFNCLNYSKAVTALHACNSNTLETGAGGSRVQG